MRTEGALEMVKRGYDESTRCLNFRVRFVYDDPGAKEALRAIGRYNRFEPEAVIRGTGATEVYQTIIRKGYITFLDHAAYLGRELEKAEIALATSRSYQQEEPIF